MHKNSRIFLVDLPAKKLLTKSAGTWYNKKFGALPSLARRSIKKERILRSSGRQLFISTFVCSVGQFVATAEVVLVGSSSLSDPSVPSGI